MCIIDTAFMRNDVQLNIIVKWLDNEILDANYILLAIIFPRRRGMTMTTETQYTIFILQPSFCLSLDLLTFAEIEP